ncbi:MAG: type II secretion system F family protein [Gammaproteobacteria bacterium]|nr:type II secretion system F family protein [Gammaproteobacteria bacterium]
MAKKSPKAAKKVQFAWEGVNKQGRKIKGEESALSADLVKASLRKQGIIPKKVKKKPQPLFGGGAKKITPGDIAVFSRQLATMLKAGVPLVQAFGIVGEGHDNPSMRTLILQIKTDVEAGGTFHQALKKHPDYFDDLFCNLVDAGEQAGALETLLEKIATYKEKSESLKAKIKKALVYPVSVLVVAFAVTAILLMFVVPVFADMFKGFGAELPVFTQFVVGLSDSFIANWYIIFAGIGGTIYGFKTLKKKSEAFNLWFDGFVLKAPVISELTNKSAIARFARTLSTMFAAGVPLVEAMNSVAGAAGNRIYTKAILRVRDDIAAGQQLQISLQQSGLFPNMVIQMVAIGEESGALDDMLSKVADYYEEQVDNAVDSLTALMEPMIMVFLAIVIGGLVIAMYLPIFKMGDAI